MNKKIEIKVEKTKHDVSVSKEIKESKNPMKVSFGPKIEQNLLLISTDRIRRNKNDIKENFSDSSASDTGKNHQQEFNTEKDLTNLLHHSHSCHFEAKEIMEGINCVEQKDKIPEIDLRSIGKEDSKARLHKTEKDKSPSSICKRAGKSPKYSIQNKSSLSKYSRIGYARTYRISKRVSTKKRTDEVTRGEITLRELLFKQRLDRFINNIRAHAGLNDIKRITSQKLNIINDRGASASEILSRSRVKDTVSKDKGLFNKGAEAIGKEGVTSQAKKRMLKLSNIVKEYIGNVLFAIKNAFHFLDEKIPVLKPFGKFKVFWESLMLTLTIWNLLSLSIVISFGMEMEQGASLIISFIDNGKALMAFQVFCLLVYSIDIFLKFNTGIYKHGEPIYDRKIIFKKYLMSGLAFDVLGTLPFWISFFKSDNINEKHVYLLFFKLYPLQVFFKNINEALLNIEGKFEAPYHLFKLLLTFLTVCHVFACIWHYQALGEKEMNWILKQNLQNSEWSERYMKSLYFILVTMTTVGYGDISPSNKYEYIISMACMLIGSGLVGYSINSIGTILKKNNKMDTEFRNKMQLINSYMNKNRVDESLKLRLRKYFEYIWKIENSANEAKCEELLKELPNSMREELLTQTRFWALRNIFGDRFTKSTVSKLLKNLTHAQYNKEEWIFHEGDIDSDLYIIVKGSVDMLLNESSKSQEKYIQLMTKEAGEIMGMSSFFKDSPKDTSCRAKTVCTVLKLSRKKFIEILKEDSSDYEKFCFMKDKIFLYGDLSVIGRKCNSCGEVNHSLKSCHYITYQPVKDIIIRRHLISKPQSRRHFKRAKSLKENFRHTLLQAPVVKNTITCYQQQNYLQVKNLREKYAGYLNTVSINISGITLDNNVPVEESSEHPSFKDDTNDLEETLKKLKSNEPFKKNVLKSYTVKGIEKHSEYESSDNGADHYQPKSSPFIQEETFPKEELIKEEHKINEEVVLLKSIDDKSEMKNARFSLKNQRSRLHSTEDPKNISELENNEKTNRTLRTTQSKFGQSLFNTEFDIGFSGSAYFPHNNREIVVSKLKRK